MDRLIRHFNDKIHRQCFGFRVSISPTLIPIMLKHERPKSLWTKRVCDGNQYGGHKLGVGAIILVCRMLIKVMRIIRMVPMMVTRVLKIQATMTVATSITSDDVFRCFYPGRHPETSRKQKTQDNYRQTIRYLNNSAIYLLVLSLFLRGDLGGFAGPC